MTSAVKEEEEEEERWNTVKDRWTRSTATLEMVLITITIPGLHILIIETLLLHVKVLAMDTAKVLVMVHAITAILDTRP